MQYGREQPAWLCRCDCGREERVPQKRLPYCESNAKARAAVSACDVCRLTRECVVCKKAFVSQHYRATCSDSCNVLHQRRKDMDRYYRLMEAGSDRNSERYRRMKQRAAEDPAFAARMEAASRAGHERRREKLRSDPAARERANALARERYRKHAAEIAAKRRERRAALSAEDLERSRQAAREVYRRTAEIVQARRREAWASLSPQERAQRQERLRELDREWRRQWREMLRGDPQALARFRQQEAEWERRRALRKLDTIAAELAARFKDFDDDER